MNEPQNKTKFAVASGPVNRRTAAQDAVAAAQRNAPAAPAAALLSRMHAAQAKRRLGAPLAVHIGSAAGHVPSVGLATPTLIAQTVACTVCATGVFVASIQAAWPVAGLCAAATLGIGAWTWRGWRARRTNLYDAPALTNWIDTHELERLDVALEEAAKACTPPTLELLVQLKECIRRCIALAAGHHAQLAPQDLLFIGQAIRRYVPDTLAAWLKVPAAEREMPLPDGGHTALQLLHSQITLLTDQLGQREAKLNQLSGEALLSQQRFLAAKTKLTHVDQ